MNREPRKSSSETISALLVDPDLSLRDFLLYVTIRKSSEMAGFYARLSRSMKQEPLKLFFNEMAQVKHEEVSYFETQYRVARKFLSGDEEPIASPPIEVPLSIDTIENACQFAATLEIMHFRFFSRLAELESDSDVEELYLFVLRMHKMSLQFLDMQWKSQISLNAQTNSVLPD